MSNRTLQRDWVVSQKRVSIFGSFVPLTGSGTVLASAVRGEGFGYAPVNGAMALKAQPQNNPTPLSTPGILRTNTGLYTIIFEDPYLDIDSVHCHLAGPATGVTSGGSALFAQAVDPVANLATANTGPTLTVVIVNNAGTPTECVASCRLHFRVTFRDSNVHYQKP